MLYLPFCAWVYVPITTTIGSGWLNSLIPHDDNKCFILNNNWTPRPRELNNLVTRRLEAVASRMQQGYY